ncbi:MAG TPA: PadR family transcriptional regulator [Gemmatimonadaceae bacterium]|nr:PadR family transcriptional regulator [Gemmatimonadaceae bacterium]
MTTIDLTIMDDRSQILAGTLDLLILKTLSAGPFHGYGLAQHIKRLSRDALRVEEGSLYPALQRMQAKGWITSELKKTPTGRTARYYRLTAAGRRQLGEEESEFQRAVAATMRVLRGAES